MISSTHERSVILDLLAGYSAFADAHLARDERNSTIAGAPIARERCPSLERRKPVGMLSNQASQPSFEDLVRFTGDPVHHFSRGKNRLDQPGILTKEQRRVPRVAGCTRF